MRLTTPAAVLLACAIVAGCGDGGDKTAPQEAPEEVSEAVKLARVATLPAPYNTADLKNGRLKYALCRSCHTLEEHGPKMTGPHLDELFGRKAGADEDYNYTEALAGSGIVWDAATLDAWVERPKDLVPGTKMAFAGLKDPKDRIDLIGYLMAETGEAD